MGSVCACHAPPVCNANAMANNASSREWQRAEATMRPVSPQERNRVRIAQIAPLFESVPPRLYGGTERVVSNLTEQLVKLGHDVTLFASGDSLTSARLIPACKTALRLNPRCVDPLPHHIIELDQVLHRAD